MKQRELPDQIKKNLLDLHYNRYLQYFNTVLILIFTYIVGLVIAFLSGEIEYTNQNQILLIAFITLVFLVFTILLLIKFKEHMKNIIQEIKQLTI